jgi:hypothetical protein
MFYHVHGLMPCHNSDRVHQEFLLSLFCAYFFLSPSSAIDASTFNKLHCSLVTTPILLSVKLAFDTEKLLGSLALIVAFNLSMQCITLLS